MRIGELSRASGVSPRSLRYYEQHRLIESVRRENGYREYGPDAVDRARAIHAMFSLGATRDVVASVLACMGRDAPVDEHRAAMANLSRFRDDLSAEIERLRSTQTVLDAVLEQNRMDELETGR